MDDHLAAIVDISGSDDDGASYEAFASGASAVYLPRTLKEYDGWNSLITIQNLGTANATVTISYEGYEADAYDVSIAPDDTHTIYVPDESFLPTGYAGGAQLNSNQPIAAVVELGQPGTASGDQAGSYSSPIAPADVIYLPLAPKSYSGTSATWDSSLVVQNTASSTATVTVTFYQEDGTPITPVTLGPALDNPFSLAAGATQEISLAQISDLSSGRYAVLLSTDQPIVGIAVLEGRMGGTAERRRR